MAALREAVPGLLDGRCALITEFGRSLLAKNGFIGALVEYTKDAGGRRIALTHAGAQTATRTVFMPDAWPLRVGAFDAEGRPKDGPSLVQDIAGPCCFAGDVVAQARELPELPELRAGDYVLLYDTGAYYFSTPVVLQQPAATRGVRIRDDRGNRAGRRGGPVRTGARRPVTGVDLGGERAGARRRLAGPAPLTPAGTAAGQPTGEGSGSGGGTGSGFGAGGCGMGSGAGPGGVGTGGVGPGPGGTGVGSGSGWGGPGTGPGVGAGGTGSGNGWVISGLRTVGVDLLHRLPERLPAPGESIRTGYG